VNIQNDEMLGQALKGLYCALGGGSGISNRAIAPELLEPAIDNSWESPEIWNAIARAGDGISLVLASKFVSYLEGRVLKMSPSFRPGRNPSIKERVEILNALAAKDAHVTEKDVIMLDAGFEKDTWVLGPIDPNRSAHEFSQLVFTRSGCNVDVIVTDSGAGVSKGEALIGCTTYTSTPVGATKGISLLHAQRFAAAAELIRNRKPYTPIVLVLPGEDHRRARQFIGEFRYQGFIDASRESRMLLEG
jgi:hypothetical protein